MDGPPTAAPDEPPRPQADARTHTVQVRWTRPTFVTYFTLAVSWGLSTGIALGVVGMAASLLGAETTIGLFAWGGRGPVAGVAGLLWWPILLAMFSTLTAVLYPVFLLGVIALRGPRLHFQVENGLRLPFSRIGLWSYVKLSAMYGFLLSLLPAVIVAATIPVRDAANISVAGLPLPSHGAARLLAIVSLAPVFYALFAALAGVFSFLPFRLLARATSLALPSREVFPNVYQYSLRTLMLFVTGCALACSLLATVRYLTREPPRFEGRDSWCVGNGRPITLHATVRVQDGRYDVVYGFAIHEGIHSWRSGPDGLWLDGKKVALPAASRFFAILDDGRIVPIVLDDWDLTVLVYCTGEIKAPEMVGKITAPFEKKAGGGTTHADAERPAN